MTTPTARRTGRTARQAGRQAADSGFLAALARGGFAARGVMYVIIGAIALDVAFDHSGHKADSSGALRLLASNPAGEIALWLLVIGFAGMTLWQLAEAGFGAGPDGQKAGKRLAAAARAIFYGAWTYGILKYALGAGAPASSDKKSRDLTASVMAHPGGRIVVIAVGAGFAIGGIVLGYRAWKKKFLDDLELNQAGPTTRRLVERLGQAGGIARAAVFLGAGVFLVIAGVNARPGEAKGVDSTLRAFAATPLGPWLLVLVALGLLTFGVYSWFEARWYRA